MFFKQFHKSINPSDDQSPLHYAINSNHEDILPLLIEHGADLNAKSIPKIDTIIQCQLSVSSTFEDMMRGYNQIPTTTSSSHRIVHES